MTTEIDCPECGKTVDSRGLHGHMRWHHPNSENQKALPPADDNPPEPEGGEEAENVLRISGRQNSDENNSEITCPTCNSDTIGDAAKVIQEMKRKGYSKEQVHEVRTEEWVCGDCYLAFSEEDI